MPDIEPIVPGIHARSEALVETTRDHDRSRVTDAVLSEAVLRDTEDLVGVQAAAGFRHLANGQLAWQDIFRPLGQLIHGLEGKTLSRFLDTNTFYRRPDVAGMLRLRTENLGSFFAQFMPSVGAFEGVVTLPSPTAFVTGARQENGSFPAITVAAEIAKIVYPTLFKECKSRGFSTVVLTDPWLGRFPQPGAVLDAIRQPLGGIQFGGPLVLFQLPFTDAAPLLDEVCRTPVSGVIVDLTLTDASALKRVPSRLALGLGVVDARSSLVERADFLAATVDRVTQGVQTDHLFLAPTGDLQHVPERIARQKVRALGEAARLVHSKNGGGA